MRGQRTAEPIDLAFLAAVDRLGRSSLPASGPGPGLEPAVVTALFRAQLQSRHLDFAARWLQQREEGFYTIGSAGHEANAAVGLLTRVDDPALLHYRSGAFYAARAALHAGQHPEAATDPVRDVLLSLASAAADPISGGRHKVFGHPALHVVPQTSTIASHLPRAVGLAFALDSLRHLSESRDWPDDAVVVCSFGDASVNHSTAQGALNAAAYLAHRRVRLPLLLVCEDNGIGISTRTPAGWTARTLGDRPDIAYVSAPDPAPDRLVDAVRRAVDHVRTRRRPAVLHLRTVRFMGHAGSDAELAYRTQSEIVADHARDPLLATAGYLVAHGVLTAAEVHEQYEGMRARVMAAAQGVVGTTRLGSRDEVTRPLAIRGRDASPVAAQPTARDERSRAWAGRLPETQGSMTLAQSLNAALTDILAAVPEAVVLGQDVGRKGGVYGVTRGLRRRFGGARVFDTLLDEQTILGVGLGASLAGVLPIPEIQYLAYLHNAEDQLRGEAASLKFFSNDQYRNPMVVRVAGLAYQKGFGGHFHNDNSVAVLRDVPGLVVCVPSHPAQAPALLRECVGLAREQGVVCVVVEPIALYHAKDLHEPGDALWTAPYLAPPDTEDEARTETDRGRLGSVGIIGEGQDLLVVTFGNGVPMSLRAARRLEQVGIGVTVLDLRWLSPLPVAAVVAHAQRFTHVLVVDETRASGGVADAVVAALTEAAYAGTVRSVRGADSYIPLGPAARTVLVGEDDIVVAAISLVARDG